VFFDLLDCDAPGTSNRRPSPESIHTPTFRTNNSPRSLSARLPNSCHVEVCRQCERPTSPTLTLNLTQIYTPSSAHAARLCFSSHLYNNIAPCKHNTLTGGLSESDSGDASPEKKAVEEIWLFRYYAPSREKAPPPCQPGLDCSASKYIYAEEG
jgi:hypothetical protein